MHRLVAKAARRTRRRYSEEFKRQVIEACLQPGVSVAASAPAREIRLDVRRGGTTVRMAWPLEAAASLGQCLRELLR